MTVRRRIGLVLLGVVLGSLAAYGLLVFLAADPAANLFRYQGF
jgi:hypothetical protein